MKPLSNPVQDDFNEEALFPPCMREKPSPKRYQAKLLYYRVLSILEGLIDQRRNARDEVLDQHHAPEYRVYHRVKDYLLTPIIGEVQELFWLIDPPAKVDDDDILSDLLSRQCAHLESDEVIQAIQDLRKLLVTKAEVRAQREAEYLRKRGYHTSNSARA